MLWIFGGAQGEQPGGVGICLIQFVLLFLESSSKGHKAASAGGSNTGVIHSWGMKIAISIQVSKFNSVFCFLISQVLLQYLGWLHSERGQAFKVRRVKQRACGQIEQSFAFLSQDIQCLALN